MKRIISLILAFTLACSALLIQASAYDQTSHPNTYQNTGDYAADIVGVALTQVGYHETPLAGDYTKYNDWFFGYEDTEYAWCAIFTSWCAAQADIPVENLNHSCHARNSTYENYPDKANYFFGGTPYPISTTPKPGDIFFSNTSDSAASFSNHVGIVWKVENGYVYTIEGNTHFWDTTTKSYVGYVATRMYNQKTGYQYYPTTGKTSADCHLLFFVHPDYEGLYIEEKPPVETPNYGNVPYGGRPAVTHNYPFRDVPQDSYYADAVEWAFWNSVTKGTSETTFSPNNTCTRAEAVSFIYRSEGRPDGFEPSEFEDVPASAYYATPVAWASSNRITHGTSSTSFTPARTVTRAEFVTFLYRLYGLNDSYTDSGSSAKFSDVPQDSYYAKAVSWAVDQRITSGTSATEFSPNKTCTRAEAVTFLYRYSKLL